MKYLIIGLTSVVIVHFLASIMFLTSISVGVYGAYAMLMLTSGLSAFVGDKLYAKIKTRIEI